MRRALPVFLSIRRRRIAKLRQSTATLLGGSSGSDQPNLIAEDGKLHAELSNNIVIS